MIKYDCYDIKHKSPLGAVRCESDTLFRVGALSTLNIDHVNMVVRSDGQAHTFELAKTDTCDDYDFFETKIRLHESGFYRYRFELVRPDGIMYFSGTQDGHTALVGDWLPEWTVFAYDSDFETPSDTAGAVMYQIFPDRFYKAQITARPAANERIMHESWNERPQCCYDYPGFKCNDFFGGNLRGIEQKLPYLKELSVTHIYLNPIFESAENHRYSTSDYLSIDPLLGDNSDFVNLCNTAEKHGIKIILDGVFSHTGDDSIYFNKYRHYGNGGAYNDPESPYFDWYSFTEFPEQYDCWWGFKTLPNVRETQSSYREFITGKDGVLRYWLRLGASGWRLDVADELPDEFLDNIRDAVKSEKPEALIIGEVWENAVTKFSYGAQRRFLRGKQCDSVMNYPFCSAITAFVKNHDAESFYSSVMEIVNDYPAPALKCLMNMLSTHDTARIINRLALDVMPPRSEQRNAVLSDELRALGISRFKTAAVLQFTLPGIPCVYYGDEVGMDGFEDPFCRKTYPWGAEDESLLNLHIMLGKIRADYKSEFERDICFIRHDGGFLHYTRGKIHVIANFTDISEKPTDLKPLLISENAAIYIKE